MSQGRSDVEASILLGVETGGLAYWVAALRETFEEAGLLLAERPDGPPLLAGDVEEEARFVAERALVNRGERRFLDSAVTSACSCWWATCTISPTGSRREGASRRYDTRFFVAAAPPGQQAAHDAGRRSPRRGSRRGGPWRATARATSRSSSRPSATSRPSAASPPVPSCWRRPKSASRSVPTIEPRVIADGNGVRILLPGDDGYDEVRGRRRRRS